MIEPELKELLQKNLETSEETLKVVKSMRNAQRWGSVFRLFKWIIIIGATFGAYYYVEPYLQQALTAVSELNATVNRVQTVGNKVNNATASSTDLLKKLEGLLKGI